MKVFHQLFIFLYWNNNRCFFSFFIRDKFFLYFMHCCTSFVLIILKICIKIKCYEYKPIFHSSNLPFFQPSILPTLQPYVPSLPLLRSSNPSDVELLSF